MSIDYSVFLMVAFEVNLSYFYDFEEEEDLCCPHYHEVQGSPKFCPHCGAQFRKPKMRMFKDIKKGFNEEKVFCGEPQPLTSDVVVQYFHDMCGEEVVLAGVMFIEMGDPRDAALNTLTPLPAISTEEQLRRILQEHNVPFKEGTFGLHTVVAAG